MEQLLSITTTPIQIEVNISNARLDQSTELPSVEISRERGGYTMKAEPIRVNIDTFEIRQETGLKTDATITKELANEGMKIAYEGTARVVNEGNALAEIHNNVRPSDIAKQRSMESFKVETVMDFIPKSRPDISWDGGTISLNYQTDKLNFEWDVFDKASFEFVPPSIQFTVTERPKVEIEYLGGPIYVPPSADPNYKGSKLDIKG